MARGFVYLTAVVDVASRRVLAHRVAITLEAAHNAQRPHSSIQRLTPDEKYFHDLPQLKKAA